MSTTCANLTFANYNLTCATPAGLQEIWVAEWSGATAPNWTSDSTNQVTGATANPTFRLLELPVDQGRFEEAPVQGGLGGTSFQPIIEWVCAEISQNTINIVNELASTFLSIIVKDQDDTYWIVKDRPVRISGGAGRNHGSAIADEASIRIEFSTSQNTMVNTIDVTGTYGNTLLQS